jgi:hypothetical protein
LRSGEAFYARHHQVMVDAWAFRPTRWKAEGDDVRATGTRRLLMAEGPWFFCLKHHTVETRDGCAERHRLGPYATREEAERAVQSVAEREQKLTAEDRAWEGD